MEDNEEEEEVVLSIEFSNEIEKELAMSFLDAWSKDKDVEDKSNNGDE